jgi:hypothetical protein
MQENALTDSPIFDDDEMNRHEECVGAEPSATEETEKGRKKKTDIDTRLLTRAATTRRIDRMLRRYPQQKY